MLESAQRGTAVTDRTRETLVCVYYRVGDADVQRVISGVREFQRTLQPAGGVNAAEVLLRCGLPSPASTAALPDARAPSLPPTEPAEANASRGADATVMETYRLSLPALAADADVALRTFLASLEAAALPRAGLLRGARHVELFAPCAS